VQTRLRLLHTLQADLARLLPKVRATRRAGLALLTTGVLDAQTVRVPRIAEALDLDVQIPSTERRLRRWLANPAVDPEALWAPLLPDLLAQLAGAAPTFVLDPTDLPGDHRLVVLGLAVQRRILPLAWPWVSSTHPWPVALGELVAGMAPAVNAAVPPGVVPTLLADAGLSGPAVLGACVDAGWHYLLRLPITVNSSHRVRLADGREERLWDLVTDAGQHWQEPVAIFKGTGWLPVLLTIHWDPDATAPWVLVSDHLAGGAAVARYRHRFHIESTFHDTKSRVWDLPTSKLTAQDRLARLVVALVLALWWTALLGLGAIHHGERRHFDRSDRGERGLLRLGVLVFHRRCNHARPPRTPFRRPPHLLFPAETVRE
jgi:Transposase DDE domain